MHIKKNKFLSLFFVTTLIFIIFSSQIVIAQDGEGNSFAWSLFYQNSVRQDVTLNGDYVEDYNITTNYYSWFNWYFHMFANISLSNATAIGVDYIAYYQGVGIQIYDENNEVYFASGMSPYPEYLDGVGDEEVVWWSSEQIKLYPILDTYYYGNITLWMNYENDGEAENYTIIQDWKFYIYPDNYNYVEPPTEGDTYDNLFLLGFVLSLFCCPLLFIGAIKLRRLELIGLSMFFFTVGFACFCVIINFNPFQAIAQEILEVLIK